MKLSQRESLCLDLIRSIASQLVVFGHGISFFGILTFLHEPNFPWMQNIAVVIFFILSGFIITYSTILKTRTSNYNFSDFFRDRASRIFSAYIVALVFIFCIDLVSQQIDSSRYDYLPAFNISTFFYNVFMLQDFPLWSFIFKDDWQPTSFGSARILWTISIEWWFYMFFGLMFFCYLRKEEKSTLKIVLFFVSAIVAWHYLYGSRGRHLTLYWMFGMFMMLNYDRYKEKVSGVVANSLILICSLATCISVQMKVIDGYNFIFSVFLSLAMISFLSLSDYISFERVDKLIKMLASYSFTLYLVHYSIMDLIMKHNVIDNKYIAFCAAFVLSNVTAFLISRYSEVVLQKQLKNKIRQLQLAFKLRIQNLSSIKKMK